MIRFRALLWVTLATAAVTACSDTADTSDGDGTLDQTSETSQEGGATVGEVTQGATPLEERVATVGLLNKRNNVSQYFERRPGDVIEEGPVILRLSTCERSAPWEMVQQTGAFVQLDVLERGQSDHSRVFSGWLI